VSLVLHMYNNTFLRFTMLGGAGLDSTAAAPSVYLASSGNWQHGTLDKIICLFLFFCLFFVCVCSFVRWFIRSFVPLFVHSFVCSFVCFSFYRCCLTLVYGNITAVSPVTSVPGFTNTSLRTPQATGCFPT